MKLKEFNAETAVSVRGTGNAVASIGLNVKSGLFNINRTACELMDLKAGDQVRVLQDEDDPECWYMEKVKAKGFSLREKASVSKGLLFSNTVTAKAIAASVEFKGTGGKVLVAGKPTVFEKRQLWGIITASLRNQ